MLRVDEKIVSGSGDSKRKAEFAAAWKFINNISHRGGNSLPYGKEVSASRGKKNKPTPSKKRKDAANIDSDNGSKYDSEYDPDNE